MNTFNIAIAGVTGYTGRELLRLICEHPQAELIELYGHSKAGMSLYEMYPEYKGFTDDLKILPLEELKNSKADFLFVALPHGTAAEQISSAIDGGYTGKIIDLSADFRISDPDRYEATYGRKHPCPHLLNDFVYGLTELDYDKLTGADYVANPGCFATALQLLTAPIADAGYSDPIAITGLTGSTGSGNKPSATTHHPERYGNLKAYKVLEHRHLAEARQRLDQLSNPPELLFTPVSAPFARGIWMSATYNTSGLQDIYGIYKNLLGKHPLIRFKQSLPELREAVDTPLSLIGVHSDGNHAVVGVCLDNLLKGAASQAIQNMNLMMGCSQEVGLMRPPKLI